MSLFYWTQKMENIISNAHKDAQEQKNSSYCFGSNEKCSLDNDQANNHLHNSDLKSKLLLRRENQQHKLTLKVKNLQRSRSYEETLSQGMRTLGSTITRHLVTADEKYVCRCLELMRNVSVNFGTESMGTLCAGAPPESDKHTNGFDFSRFVFEYPLPRGTANVVVNPTGQWIVGSVMGTKSMMNLLKSPILRQLGTLDGGVESEKEQVKILKDSESPDDVYHDGVSGNYSLQNLDKETPYLDTCKLESKIFHNRHISISSTNSTWSDDYMPCSSSDSATVSKGMLQCTRKDGSPCFVFSQDDQREILVAELSKVESTDDKALDYMYLFYSMNSDREKSKYLDKESCLVGRMSVSTSFTLSPKNSRLMETDFVLFAVENMQRDMQASSHSNLRKNKGLSNKVVQVLKQRTKSIFGESSAVSENSSLVPHPSTEKDLNSAGGADAREICFPPNIELAAIVVKNNLPDNCQEKVGGWGLKFLKKMGGGKNSDTNEPSLSGAYARDNGYCSTSMEVLIPYGLHGGPRTRNGGPLSLIERWRCGGQCDCGGWDLGCPLRVFKARSSKWENFSHTDTEENCKLFDFLLQGSEHESPSLKMVKVHDGLYCICFRSTVSALQCFSAAVAFVHTQSPLLQS